MIHGLRSLTTLLGALRIDRTRLTSDNADLASHLYNLATLLQETGRLEEAEPLMREAIGILVWYRAFAGHEIAHLRCRQELPTFA
jgi:hypothetical protein